LQITSLNKRIGTFKPNENIKHFMGLNRLIRILNNGIVEYCKDGFKKGYYPFLILSSAQTFSLTHHCIIPEPIIPIFQHSSIPIGAKPLT